MTTPTSAFLSFRLDGRLFAVAVADVQEIVREQTVTPVPFAPPFVEGVVNLRGQIVAALDLRGRLALTPRARDAKPIHLVVRGGGGAVSLLVDDVGDVLAIEGSRLESTPSTVAPAVRELVRGVVPLDEGLLLVLDLARTLALEGAGMPS